MLDEAMNMLGITNREIKRQWALYKSQAIRRSDKVTYNQFKRNYIKRKLVEKGADDFADLI